MLRAGGADGGRGGDWHRRCHGCHWWWPSTSTMLYGSCTYLLLCGVDDVSGVCGVVTDCHHHGRQQRRDGTSRIFEESSKCSDYLKYIWYTFVVITAKGRRNWMQFLLPFAAPSLLLSTMARTGEHPSCRADTTDTFTLSAVDDIHPTPALSKATMRDARPPSPTLTTAPAMIEDDRSPHRSSVSTPTQQVSVFFSCSSSVDDYGRHLPSLASTVAALGWTLDDTTTRMTGTAGSRTRRTTTTIL